MKFLVSLFIVKFCAQTSIFKSKIALTPKVEILTIRSNPAGNYILKVKNRNTRTRYEIS